MIFYLTALFVFFAAIAATIELKAGFWPFKKKANVAVSQEKTPAQSRPAQKRGAKCPVCKSPLLAGETLKAVVYLGRESAKSCAILGCPRCYPILQGDVFRECPVCKARLSGEDYLISRLVPKAESRNDVKIVGCSVCRPESDPSRRQLGNFPTAEQIDGLKTPSQPSKPKFS